MSTHHHHPHPSPVVGNFNRAFAIGIVLNMAFVAIEAFYGWKINSLALLADAGHNLSDVAGLVLAWAGAWAAKLRPNAQHTYGWKRASIVAAVLNALLLLVAMGALAWEAISRLGTPQATEGETIMVVAGVGIVINTATALLFMRGQAHDLNIRGAFLHMVADALVSLGVVLGGVLYLWQGWNWIDPVMSLAIAVVIVLGTWSLLRQSVHLLLDGVPERIDMVAVRQHLLALPGVAEVHDLHVWAMGTSEVALSAHVVLQSDQTDVTTVLHQAEHILHEHFDIRHATLQIEPPAYAQHCGLRSGVSSGCC